MRKNSGLATRDYNIILSIIVAIATACYDKYSYIPLAIFLTQFLNLENPKDVIISQTDLSQTVKLPADSNSCMQHLGLTVIARDICSQLLTPMQRLNEIDFRCDSCV